MLSTHHHHNFPTSILKTKNKNRHNKETKNKPETKLIKIIGLFNPSCVLMFHNFNNKGTSQRRNYC